MVEQGGDALLHEPPEDFGWRWVMAGSGWAGRCAQAELLPVTILHHAPRRKPSTLAAQSSERSQSNPPLN